MNHQPTLTEELRSGTRSLADIHLALADNALDLPPALADPAVRWPWSAALLTHPGWGMTTLTPRHRGVFVDAAGLCVDTAAITAAEANPAQGVPSYRAAALLDDWRNVDTAVTAAMAALTPGRGQWDTFDPVVELVTDSLDHLTGRDTTGTQMVAAAFGAYLAHHDGNTARSLLDDALAHVEDLTHPGAPAAPVLRAAS